MILYFFPFNLKIAEHFNCDYNWKMFVGLAKHMDMHLCLLGSPVCQCHDCRHWRSEDDPHACPQVSRGFLITVSQHSLDVLISLHEKSSLNERAIRETKCQF